MYYWDFVDAKDGAKLSTTYNCTATQQRMKILEYRMKQGKG